MIGRRGADIKDKLEKNIGDYIKRKGINLSEMARRTGIPYQMLYDSLINPARDRQLRGIELIAVCQFLDKDPRDFA